METYLYMPPHFSKRGLHRTYMRQYMYFIVLRARFHRLIDTVRKESAVCVISVLICVRRLEHYIRGLAGDRGTHHAGENVSDGCALRMAQLLLVDANASDAIGLQRRGELQRIVDCPGFSTARKRLKRREERNLSQLDSSDLW